MSSEAIKSEHKIVQNHYKVCRLCLSEELLEDIFKCDDLNLWISDYLSIVVSEDDKISCSICALCKARLNEFRDFQQRCLEVQDVLHAKSCTVFEKDLLLRETEKGKHSLESHPELTIDARQKLQPTIPDKEDEADYDGKKHYQRIFDPESGQKRCYYDELEAYQNQNIKCFTCDEKVHKSSINSHQNSHKDAQPFKCKRCSENENFNNKETQRPHHQEVHSEEQHECNICKKVCLNQRHLSIHKFNIHSSKTLLCSICNLQFKSRSGLTKHRKRVHDPKLKGKLSCPHCDCLCDRDIHLEMHLKQVHNVGLLEKSNTAVKENLDLFEAEEANIEPDLNPEQGQDASVTHADEALSLLESEEPEMSDQTVDIIQELQAEDVLKSRKRPKPSTSFEKDLPTGAVEEEKSFSETHSELKKLKPTMPDSADETDDDKRIVTTGSEQIQCNYTRKEAYQKQKIECPTCGVKVHKSHMKSHQNSHKGVRPFKCERGCENVAFYRRATRKAHHQEVHSEERYECNICSKIFRTKRSLSAHKENTHSLETFLCSICNIQFKSRAGLQRHTKTMHELNCKSKFPCMYCKRSYDRNGNLQNHLKQVHLAEIIEKSKRIRKNKPVANHEALKVKIEPDADSVEMQDVLQVDPYTSVEENLDLFEVEEAKIEPDLNPEQGQDDSITDAEGGLSLLESEDPEISDQTVDIKKELQAEEVLKK